MRRRESDPSTFGGSEEKTIDKSDRHAHKKADGALTLHLRIDDTDDDGEHDERYGSDHQRELHRSTDAKSQNAE